MNKTKMDKRNEELDLLIRIRLKIVPTIHMALDSMDDAESAFNVYSSLIISLCVDLVFTFIKDSSHDARFGIIDHISILAKCSIHDKQAS